MRTEKKSQNGQAGVANATTNLAFLDGLRGIAAAIVMIGHVRWLLWEGYSEGFLKHPGQYSAPEKVLVYFLSIFRFGHQAVLFFFVLSGFVIHLKYSKKLANKVGGGFDYGDYFRRRIKGSTRLFLFTLLLTYLLDTWVTHLGFSIYSGGTPNAIINQNVANDHSLVNLAGNLVFYRGGPVGIWGTNSPLWSLKYEWWFYVLYPALLLVNRRTLIGSTLLVVVLFLFSFFTETYSSAFFINVFEYLLAWWMGVILADIYTKRIKITHAQLSFLALLLPFLVVGETRISNFLLADICWAAGFFGLLNFFFYLRSRGAQLILLNKLKWLGDCSYTLYIIHFPVTVFLGGLALHYNHNEMPRSLLPLFAGIAFNILLAWFLHLIIERPFTNNKKAVQNIPVPGASLN